MAFPQYGDLGYTSNKQQLEEEQALPKVQLPDGSMVPAQGIGRPQGQPAQPAQPTQPTAPLAEVTPPAAAAPPPPPEKSDYEKQLDAQIAMLQRPVGAPTVKLNQDILQGIQGQREALREVLPVMAEQAPIKEKAYAGAQEAGQSYIDKLKVLAGQQTDLFNARRAEQAQELAQTKAAENTFDHSRVLRSMGENPVSTGAMSFAAGLVGALKGAAGDMSPNQVLGEVDKAVERDVENQREQYRRMQYGQQVSRNNFIDAARMGADEQKALEAATIASLDQHKRALEYAEQHITDAKAKATIKSGISALQEQLGGIRLKIDEKNASMAAAAANNRNAAIAQLMMAKQKMMAGDPETRAKAQTHADNIIGGKAFGEAQTQAQAVSRVRELMLKAKPEELKEALSPTFTNAILDGLRSAAASKENRNAFVGAFERYVGNKVASTQSEMVNQLRANVQNLVNANIKTDAGGAVNNQEEVRQALERTFQSEEGSLRWLDDQQRAARAKLAAYSGLDKTGNEFDTVVQGRFDHALLPSVLGMDEWDARTKGTAAWKQEQQAAGAKQ